MINVISALVGEWSSYSKWLHGHMGICFGFTPNTLFAFVCYRVFCFALVSLFSPAVVLWNWVVLFLNSFLIQFFCVRFSWWRGNFYKAGGKCLCYTQGSFSVSTFFYLQKHIRSCGVTWCKGFIFVFTLIWSVKMDVQSMFFDITVILIIISKWLQLTASLVLETICQKALTERRSSCLSTLSLSTCLCWNG